MKIVLELKCVSIAMEILIKPIKNTLDLVKYLMNKYNISIDKVVRHYDASRKSCPDTWKQDNWEMWNKFKSDLLRLDAKNHKDYTPSITLLYKMFYKENQMKGA